MSNNYSSWFISLLQRLLNTEATRTLLRGSLIMILWFWRLFNGPKTESKLNTKFTDVRKMVSDQPCHSCLNSTHCFCLRQGLMQQSCLKLSIEFDKGWPYTNNSLSSIYRMLALQICTFKLNLRVFGDRTHNFLHARPVSTNWTPSFHIPSHFVLPPVMPVKATGLLSLLNSEHVPSWAPSVGWTRFPYVLTLCMYAICMNMNELLNSFQLFVFLFTGRNTVFWMQHFSLIFHCNLIFLQ